MRILVFGAGVIGSLYAARLKDAGLDVTILARARRFQFLCENGIILDNGYTEERTVHEIPVTDRIDPADVWDLIIVCLRKNQIADALPELKRANTESVLFMGNNVKGPGELIAALGAERVLMGFPGAGGIMEEDVVRYVDSDEGRGSRWGVTIGEIDGSQSKRIEEIKDVFHSSMSVETTDNITAWVMTHASIAVPIAHALYLVEGGTYELADRQDVLRLMIFAVRESLNVQESLEIPIVPKSVKIYRWIPVWVATTMMRARLSTRMAEIGIEGHALAAQDEMAALADEYVELIKQVSFPTPALHALYNIHDDE